MTTLRVRNQAQKLLFDEELKGQISDGMWENARPNDHWVVWSDAEVIVDSENVGRDFFARKDSYNFTSTMLIECVGDRMREYVRSNGIPTYSTKQMLADLRDLKMIVKTRSESVVQS